MKDPFPSEILKCPFCKRELTYVWDDEFPSRDTLLYLSCEPCDKSFHDGELEVWHKLSN